MTLIAAGEIDLSRSVESLLAEHPMATTRELAGALLETIPVDCWKEVLLPVLTRFVSTEVSALTRGRVRAAFASMPPPPPIQVGNRVTSAAATVHEETWMHKVASSLSGLRLSVPGERRVVTYGTATLGDFNKASAFLDNIISGAETSRQRIQQAIDILNTTGARTLDEWLSR